MKKLNANEAAAEIWPASAEPAAQLIRELAPVRSSPDDTADIESLPGPTATRRQSGQSLTINRRSSALEP